MSNETRDCANCIHKVPVFDEEEGIWRGADCDAWECNFVSREEALKAYEIRTQSEAPTVELDEVTELGREITNIIKDIMPQILEIAKNNIRPQGEWIRLRDYDFKCSLCGESMMDEHNFCPNCGALMKGGAE